MVWHETHLPDIDHWVIMMYLWNLVVENDLPQQRWLEPWLFATGLCGTYNLAEHRQSASNHYGHLVCSWHCVVMPIHASCLTPLIHEFCVITLQFSMISLQRYCFSSRKSFLLLFLLLFSASF